VTMYFAVLGMRRADLSERVVALLSTPALARRAGCRFLAERPDLLRCRVRRVFLTREQEFVIVRQWGRDDAARGSPVTRADALPDPYRGVYLDAYMAARKGAG
jgi:hypothetical protein